MRHIEHIFVRRFRAFNLADNISRLDGCNRLVDRRAKRQAGHGDRFEVTAKRGLFLGLYIKA